jgi:uncharacterized protein YoxC
LYSSEEEGENGTGEDEVAKRYAEENEIDQATNEPTVGDKRPLQQSVETDDLGIPAENLKKAKQVQVEEVADQLASEELTVIPDNVEEIPDNVEEIPDNVEEVPDNVEEVPDNVEEVPDNVEEVPDNVEEVPDNVQDDSDDEKPHVCAVHLHAKNKWGQWEELSHTAYVKEGGKYFKTKCGSCTLVLCATKKGANTTLFNNNNPGRVCGLCKDYLVCKSCYVASIMENDTPDPNDDRRMVRKRRNK